MIDYSGDGIGAPGRFWFGIIPDDDHDLPAMPRCLYIGDAAGGDIALVGADGVSQVFTVAQGYHPLRPKRVLADGTTVTKIIGIY